MGHTLKIEVERDCCIGSGDCVRLAPGTFDQDDSGFVVLVDPQAADAEAILAAERNCPVGAITVTEE